jgi:hypothetical protein
VFKTESNNSAHDDKLRSAGGAINPLPDIYPDSFGSVGRWDSKKRKGGDSGRGGGAEERRERTAAFPDAVSMSSHCYWSFDPSIQTTRIAGQEGKRMR